MKNSENHPESKICHYLMSTSVYYESILTASAEIQKLWLLWNDSLLHLSPLRDLVVGYSFGGQL